MDKEWKLIVGVKFPKQEVTTDKLTSTSNNPFQVLAEPASTLRKHARAAPMPPEPPDPPNKHVHWKDQMRSKRKQRKEAARSLRLADRELNEELTILASRNNMLRHLPSDVQSYREKKADNKIILKSILKVSRRGKRDKLPRVHKAPDEPAIGPIQQLRNRFRRLAEYSANLSLFNLNKSSSSETAVVDSGATNHFGTDDGGMVSTGVPSTKIVGAANGTFMRASTKAVLPMSQLRPEAREADIIPDLKNSLISISKLADSSYVTIFQPGNKGVAVYDENDVQITVTGEAVLQGWREGNLWRVPLKDGSSVPINEDKLSEAAHNLFELPSLRESIRYLHASLGFPVKSTWLKAIRAGNFAGWPLVTVENVNKYFPESDETQMGHLNQQRQGVRSTKTREPLMDIDTSMTKGKKEKDVYFKVFDMKNQIYTDQTGAFPIRSRGGHRYLMVMLEIDSNAILVEPMKSRKDEEMQRAYLALIGRLKRAGVQIKKHVLDNECSQAMKDLIEQTCKYELVPPDSHRRNIAETSIKNYKQHFISVLSGLPPSFPMNMWHKLLPQTELTLNLLRQSNAYPTVSAHQALFGVFDYNRQPLAPLGCEVLVHEATARRSTWGQHAKKGWSLGTSAEHYRSHLIFVKDSAAERVCETVFFKHHYITKPKVTHADVVIAAAQNLAKVIQCKPNYAGEENLRGLKVLSEMFSSIAEGKAPADWEREYTPDSNQQEQELPPPRVEMEKSTAERAKTPLPRVPEKEPARTSSTITAPSKSVSPLQKLISDFKAAAHSPTENIFTPKRLQREMRAPEISSSNILPTRTRSGGRTSTSSDTSEHLANALFALDTMEAEYLKPSAHNDLTDFAYQLLASESAYNVLDPDTGKSLNYRQLRQHPKLGPAWDISSANEFGRLAQGIGGRVKGTNTIFFIPKGKVPLDRRKDVSYGKFVCKVRPEKVDEPNRTRLTVGGNLINYPFEVGTPTADLLLAKILFNSVISTKNARFMTIDIKNFYLNTPMQRYEYIKLKLSDIPSEVIEEYNLRSIATDDDFVYVEIRAGMYGLPQAGLIAQELLEKRLNKEGYYQDKYVPGLWHHEWRPINFTLVVDDFGVKYVGKEHADHLLGVIQKHYKCTKEWDGKRYIGIKLDWDYDRRKVHLSMPGYVKTALTELGHEPPEHKQDQPHRHVPPNYGAKTQYATPDDNTPPLGKASASRIRKITGKFLYLGRAVDGTLLTPLSAIASNQSNPTTDTLAKATQFLDYVSSQEEAVLTYNASEMILAAHSDASYLCEPNARSRAGGHFFLSNNDPFPPNNGAILNIAQIIKHVMTSAAEAELAALYINAREAIYIRLILQQLGHPQPATPIQTDNSTAEGVINSKVQPKRTKAMDMRFHWLRDRETLKQFRIYWRPGRMNYADYWTKHHPAAHHRNIRPEILSSPSVITELNQRNKEVSARVC